MPDWDAIDRRSWIDLTNDENEAIWHRVFANLIVDPARPPTFVEPSDSVTWELREIPDSPRRSIAEDEKIVATELRRALGAIVGTEQWVYALDWQHGGYRFAPAQEAHHQASTNSWPIPAIPNGDYCLFLAQDLRFGWLGHPWEPTICVYGDLLAPLTPALDKMGWPIIRTGRKRPRRHRTR